MMKIDVNKIDEKIKMLEAIRQIASNPEMASLLEGVMTGSNGRSPAARTPTSQQGRTKPAKQTFVRGALKQAVVQAMRKHGKPFSGYELTAAMLAEGSYTFTATRPAIAVNDVLRTMLKNKEDVKIHHKGKGGEPHTYVYVKPQAEGGTGRASGD